MVILYILIGYFVVSLAYMFFLIWEETLHLCPKCGKRMIYQYDKGFYGEEVWKCPACGERTIQ